MFRAVKLAHFIGLTLFLGSIFAFIVISALINGSGLETVAFGRRIIATGTNVLTLPGMWLLAITGVWLGYRRYGLDSRFTRLKLAIIAVAIINTHLIIGPAVSAAAAIAAASVEQGRLLPEYESAYLRESIFGTLNILLVLSASIVGVWRIGAKAGQPVARTEADLPARTCEDGLQSQRPGL